jgi:hypothetical protein
MLKHLARVVHLGSVLVLVACGRKPVTQLSATPDAAASRWNASLTAPEAVRALLQARGSSSLSPEDDGRRSRLDIAIENLVPGGDYAWSLVTGQCGLPGADVYRSDDKRRLRIGKDGRADASTVIDLPFPSSGDYLVRVISGTPEMPQVIACGNLAPPTIRLNR